MTEMTKEELKESVADMLTDLCDKLATVIVAVSTDERHLLDGIDLAHEGIRTMATEKFVAKQKQKIVKWIG